jgi:hypothetical protein
MSNEHGGYLHVWLPSSYLVKYANYQTIPVVTATDPWTGQDVQYAIALPFDHLHSNFARIMQPYTWWEPGHPYHDTNHVLLKLYKTNDDQGSVVPLTVELVFSHYNDAFIISLTQFIQTLYKHLMQSLVVSITDEYEYAFDYNLIWQGILSSFFPDILNVYWTLNQYTHGCTLFQVNTTSAASSTHFKYITTQLNQLWIGWPVRITLAMEFESLGSPFNLQPSNLNLTPSHQVILQDTDILTTKMQFLETSSSSSSSASVIRIYHSFLIATQQQQHQQQQYIDFMLWLPLWTLTREEFGNKRVACIQCGEHSVLDLVCTSFTNMGVVDIDNEVMYTHTYTHSNKGIPDTADVNVVTQVTQGVVMCSMCEVLSEQPGVLFVVQVPVVPTDSLPRETVVTIDIPIPYHEMGVVYDFTFLYSCMNSKTTKNHRDGCGKPYRYTHWSWGLWEKI